MTMTEKTGAMLTRTILNILDKDGRECRDRSHDDILVLWMARGDLQKSGYSRICQLVR